MDAVLKRKATVKFNTHQNDASTSSRPASPFKPHAQSSSSSSTLSVRPKAKVNSSVAPARKAASVVSSAKSATVAVRRERSVTSFSASPTPRPTSPFKPNLLRPSRRDDSPTFQPKARATVQTLRPHTAQSVIGSSESRQRSLTSVASDVGPLNGSRTRHGSISLQHAASFASLHRSQPSSRSTSPVASPTSKVAQVPDVETLSALTSIKIKAKVTGLAKQSNNLDASPSVHIPPPQSSLRSPPTRARAPSITNVNFSAPSSPNPNFTIYPITTATPAANPHRYAPPRPSPPSSSRQQYQPFRTSNANDNRSPDLHSFSAKVDPASIPLPPHSPPISALSVSSKSSVSRSSVQHTASCDSSASPSIAPTPHLNGKYESRDYDQVLRSTLDDLVRHIEFGDANTSGDSGHDRDDDDIHDQEHKAKAQAKSDRKIEDLEISNRSLLAINASLEATKHKQAKEIRELRRKLRESRLILPPRAYRAVKSSYGPDDEEPDDEYEEDNSEKEEDSDIVYKRIKALIEDLLAKGKRALETKSDNVSSHKSGAKVLSAEEIKHWQESSTLDHEGDDERLTDDRKSGNPGNHLSRTALAYSEDSEDEVEAIALAFTPPPSHLSTAPHGSLSPPPILVTESR